MSKSTGNYPALRVIVAWYKVVGYFIGGIIALGGLISIMGDGSAAAGIGLLIGAVVFIVLSVAVAEIIQVFLDTQNNTRESADALHRLVELQSSPGLPDPAPKPVAPAAPARAAEPIGRGNPPARKHPAAAPKATREQAESIRGLIKSLHGDGETIESIAKELQVEGLPTLDGSGTWTAEAVSSVLRES